MEDTFKITAVMRILYLCLFDQLEVFDEMSSLCVCVYAIGSPAETSCC